MALHQSHIFIVPALGAGIFFVAMGSGEMIDAELNPTGNK